MDAEKLLNYDRLLRKTIKLDLRFSEVTRDVSCSIIADNNKIKYLCNYRIVRRLLDMMAYNDKLNLELTEQIINENEELIELIETNFVQK